MEFISPNEYADRMAKKLLNMKQACELVQTMLPNAEVRKEGRNNFVVRSYGATFYFSKLTCLVEFNARSGVASRTRHLGFSQHVIRAVLDSNI